MGYHQTAFWKAYDRITELVDRKIGWHRLPTPLGLLTLLGLRDTLRKRNLYDTDGLPSVNLPPIDPPSAQARTARTLDGSYNDLEHPRTGMAGSRFGRNVPIELTDQDPRLMEP